MDFTFSNPAFNVWDQLKFKESCLGDTMLSVTSFLALEEPYKVLPGLVVILPRNLGTACRFLVPRI